jgi:hypothetical protein
VKSQETLAESIDMPELSEIVNPELDEALKQTAGIKPKEEIVEEVGPLYRKMKGSKIPVSKQLGKLFKSRIDQSASARKEVETCWSEAIKYYDNDQMSHRTEGSSDRAGNRRNQRKINDRWSETENVVFSNSVTMLPMLYAKNPNVEITAVNAATNEALAKCYEKLINTLLSMKIAPGVNMKSKARRGVLWALLTNNAYTRVDFINKEESSEGAIAEIEKLSKAYEEAKTQKEIREIEGQLQALEESVNILSPAGPTVKLVNPFRLYWDKHTEPDHSDAMWAAEYDYLPTDYLNAVYGKRVDKQWQSVYEPTHVLHANSDAQGIDDDVNNFSLFQKEEAHSKFGYGDHQSYKKACFTKVWWIWDKATRRLLLYADNNWNWPLWVWDDPLKLIEFFPYDHLWFHETPEGSQPKGEVTYYLDQQDAINDMNSTVAQSRAWARLKLFYNQNKIKHDDAQKLLNSDEHALVPVDLDEGQTLKDVFECLTPPAIQFAELFNPESKFAAINRITGINDAQRGAQFKTNTTNDAIDFYQKNVDIRVDEKIDAIEDWIGMIAWKVLQLVARKWSKEDVARIIGADAAEPWEQITDPNDLRTRLLVRVVGGSTDKPTSKNKKKAALEIGQVLGQFANAIPAAGIVALKVFSRAFADDIVITDDDWNMIFRSMEQQQQKAGAGPGGEQPPTDPNAEAPKPEQEQQIRDMIAALPPEAKQQMEQLIQQGTSPTEALQQVTQ